MKFLNFFLIACFIFTLQSSLLIAQSGIPDSSLSGTGVVHIGGNEVIVQPDRKILVVGGIGSFSNMDYVVARFNNDGSSDSNFGNNGQTIIPVGIQVFEHEYARGVVGAALQPDGKIIVAGNAANEQILVVRLNQDGTLDNTFGNSGRLIATLENRNVLEFGSVAVHDEKIIIGGTTFGMYLNSTFIFKLNADGSFDTGFNSNGIMVRPEDTEEELISGRHDWSFADMAVNDDGKITVAVNMNNQFAFDGSESTFTMYRLNANGTNDNSFNPQFAMPSTSVKQLSGIALQSDGKLVVAVHYRADDSNFYFYLLRLNNNGSLDANFVGDPEWLGEFVDIAVQPDGKVIAGSSSYSMDYDFVIRKFNTDGSLDTGFGDGGIINRPGENWKYSIAVQSDNQLLTLGPNNLRRYTNNINNQMNFEDQMVTYGVAPFQVSPVSLSGGPVIYQIQSGDAASIDQSTGEVTIHSVGSVVINAEQAQWGGYGPASATATLNINRAPLTATADDINVEYGKEIPDLTISYSGFAYDDDASDIVPPEATTTATSSSAIGTYPITLSGGSAENYNLTLVNGTLTITRTLQVITFEIPANLSVSDGPIELEATTSSGLPLNYDVVAGPAAITGKTLTLTGAGTVTINISAEGNEEFEPVSVDYTFCSNPPQPTIIQELIDGKETLVSSSVNGNQWIRNGEPVEGATGQRLEVIASGLYTVTVTVDGCSSTSDSFEVLTVTSIGDEALTNISLTLHPNPVNDVLNVGYEDPAATDVEASIYTLQGVKIVSRNLLPQNQGYEGQFDTRTFPAGIYLLRLESDKKVIVKRFVKE